MRGGVLSDVEGDDVGQVINSPLLKALAEGYQDVVLKVHAGADVNAKDGDGQTALHWACRNSLEEIVQALINRGCSLDERNGSGLTSIMLTARSGHTAISMRLLRAGASCEGLTEDQMDDLFRYACDKGDMLAVQTLLKNGCSVSGLPTEKQEGLLGYACRKGNLLIVENLIQHGCNVNCKFAHHLTPLMDAAREGHDEVVKMLILAGADLEMQDISDDTALHYAAMSNQIQCGIFLAEGGASMRTRNTDSVTALDIDSEDFKEAIQQALSFTARKAICIIGNAMSGKSTLIAALQSESKSVLRKMMNRFRKVHDPRRRTAGIETVSHSSQRYGEVLFFDFAGQHEYHGPHEMFLESLVSKPGVSMTLLLVVKLTEEAETISHQLHRWLSPVALMATTDSPPQVIVIGSFLDKVRSKEEATTKLRSCIFEAENELALDFVGSCCLDCRQPQSGGIDKLCSFLQEIPIPEFRTTHIKYSLAWVIHQIRLSFTAEAVQLCELSMWIKDNKANLPQNIPTSEEVCQDMSASGHALYLPNREDLPKSWLVLDLPSILHKVYGTLFSQSKDIVNEFGLLHFGRLATLLPNLDLEMVQKLLISLEFCIPVDPSVLKVEVSKLTQCKEAKGWLFFPALITAKPLWATSGSLPQQSIKCLHWELHTSKKHSISARVLQTVLLRLAANFVVRHHLADGIHQHCCSIWWNGIAWQSKIGVDVIVHITNNRVIQVIGTGMASAAKSCEYVIDIITDILSAVHQFSPKLSADVYIVHQQKVSTTYDIAARPLPEDLFLVEDIQNSVRDCEEFSLSLKDATGWSTSMPISELFGGWTPSLELIQRMTIQQPTPTDPSPTTANGISLCAAPVQGDCLMGSQGSI